MSTKWHEAVSVIRSITDLAIKKEMKPADLFAAILDYLAYAAVHEEDPQKTMQAFRYGLEKAFEGYMKIKKIT